MFQFQDIFLIQIMGLLRSRRFSGDCHLQIDSSPACLRFAEGDLIDASYRDTVRFETLKKILWVCQGEIEIFSQSYTANDWDYSSDIDNQITQFKVHVFQVCPFFKNLVLERSKTDFYDESIFMDTAKKIYNCVYNGASIELVQDKAGLPLSEFLKGFFHLLGSGKIIGDYGQNLSLLLLKTQSNILLNLQKMLGKRVAELYHERLSEEMDNRWPNFPKHKNYDRIYGAYDRIYGTMPYRTWGALLSETITKTAPTAMGNSCYKKALSSLKPEESSLLQQLLN